MTGFEGTGFFADPTTDQRLQRPPARGEKAVLADYLEHYRGTLALK